MWTVSGFVAPSWLRSDGMSIDRTSPATSSPTAASPTRPAAARPRPGQLPAGRRPAVVWVLEAVLGVQAVLATATAVVAAHQGWNTADYGVFFGAAFIGFVAVVLATLTALPVILLHHQPGPSRRSGLPLTITGQTLVALVTLYAWTHTSLLPADAVVLGLAGPIVAVGLAALPCVRRFANAAAAGTSGPAATAAPVPQQDQTPASHTLPGSS